MTRGIPYFARQSSYASETVICGIDSLSSYQSSVIQPGHLIL